MILGIDPIYWICLGFVGMLGFVTVMFFKMVQTIQILKEIRDGHTPQKSNEPLITITTTDPFLASFGSSRRKSVSVESTSKPDTEPLEDMDITVTMPRVKP